MKVRVAFLPPNLKQNLMQKCCFSSPTFLGTPNCNGPTHNRTWTRHYSAVNHTLQPYSKKEMTHKTLSTCSSRNHASSSSVILQSVQKLFLHTVHTLTVSEEARLQVNSSITVTNKIPITYNTQDKVISLIRNKAIQAMRECRYSSIHSRMVNTEEVTQCTPEPAWMLWKAHNFAIYWESNHDSSLLQAKELSLFWLSYTGSLNKKHFLTKPSLEP